jgi:hypothetical protein
MNTFIYVSLAVNIVVLVPILVLMAVKSPLVDHAWGSFTQARGILMSIYFAILAVSVFLVFKPAPAFVFALLLVQVIYKVTTPFTVRSFSNPVVISNLFIASLHIVTLIKVFPAIQNQLFA